MRTRIVQDPIAQFQRWLNDARSCEAIPEPTAMTLATVDERGWPDARIVLLKDCDHHGLTFYTNMGSAKAKQLTANPHAAVCFHWMALERQVRLVGPVSRVTDGEADDYFASRPRASQIGAWASRQSEPLTGRLELERRVAMFAARFAVGPVPRPHFWSGFRLQPLRIEFWHKQPARLHQRTRFIRRDATSDWAHECRERLFP